MIKQIVIVFSCLAIGELMVHALQLAIPSSIVGMLLLFMGLQLKWIEDSSVDKISSFFLSLLPFFFIPSAVGVMVYFKFIEASFWSIFISAVLSTIVVLLSTAFTHQIVRSRFRRINKSKSSK